MNTELLKHAQEEYDKGTPVMSDDAFDGLTNSESQFDILEKFETERNGYEAMFYPSEEEHRLIPWLRYGMYSYLPKPNFK